MTFSVGEEVELVEEDFVGAVLEEVVSGRVGAVVLQYPHVLGHTSFAGPVPSVHEATLLSQICCLFILSPSQAQV